MRITAPRQSSSPLFPLFHQPPQLSLRFQSSLSFPFGSPFCFVGARPFLFDPGLLRQSSLTLLLHPDAGINYLTRQRITYAELFSVPYEIQVQNLTARPD